MRGVNRTGGRIGAAAPRSVDTARIDASGGMTVVDELWTATIETPVGPLDAAATGQGLCLLEFHRGGRLSSRAAHLRRWHPGAILRAGPNPHLDAARTWLARYFEGRFDALEEPALDARGTVFELAVWRAMRGVAIGSVSTYTALAERVGSPRGARAVGAASGRNPVCIIVPCHRIVGSNGSLVGYGGGLALKRRLLQHEGAIPSLLPGPRAFSTAPV
jgi:O-6-methylguanine DNA methyltransferase